jgi:hypothetical protein
MIGSEHHAVAISTKAQWRYEKRKLKQSFVYESHSKFMRACYAM